MVLNVLSRFVVRSNTIELLYSTNNSIIEQSHYGPKLPYLDFGNNYDPFKIETASFGFENFEKIIIENTAIPRKIANTGKMNKVLYAYTNYHEDDKLNLYIYGTKLAGGADFKYFKKIFETSKHYKALNIFIKKDDDSKISNKIKNWITKNGEVSVKYRID